jgi:GAF domain-containing protein
MSGSQGISFNTALLNLYTLQWKYPGEPEKALRVMVQEISIFLDVRRVTIWRFSRQFKEMRLVEAYDSLTGRFEPGQVLPVEKYPKFLHAVTHGKAFATGDVAAAPELSELLLNYWIFHQIRSAIVVPLQLDDGTRAAIFFEHSGSERRWEKGELDLANQVAGPVAQCLKAGGLKRNEIPVSGIRDIQPSFDTSSQHGAA